MKKWFGLLILGALLTLYTPCALAAVYTYDPNGNLTNGDNQYLEYNDANKLVRVRQGDASGPVIAEYVYDSGGQRIKKIENGVTTYYIGKHYEEEYTGAQQTNKASYYFANTQRAAKKDKAGNLSFVHSDHLGGTNAVTDNAGSLVERTKYYPFGDIRQGGSERYSFTGKEKDKATDFYYFEARYYKHGYRHFAQADIIVPRFYDPQSLNRYAYVQNNPVKYVDPSGHYETTSNEGKSKIIKSYDSIKNQAKNEYLNSIPNWDTMEQMVSYIEKNPLWRHNQFYKLTVKNYETTILNAEIYAQYTVTKARNQSHDFIGRFENDPNKMECTEYVAQEYEIPWGGHAGTWLNQAKRNEFAIGKEPQEGAIMVTNESGYGHVAIVTSVDNNIITVSDSNWVETGKIGEHEYSTKSRKIKGYIYTE
ncbi:RHS repeat-associated core domain-containing protein [Desulfococcaceae bacterium HSG7]|nr:RHS repeat-associated core domain-containing protein [Desulfococcaceae bacterium HSG7]